jgi:DNA-binding NarL/FixJ family response regulator
MFVVATITSNGDGRSKSGSVRLLVVEDSEPFRRFICSTLEKRTDLQIVGEVSDGSKAVQKAEELHPDLILLDVGLPSLNGIEAARKIRKLSHSSKILFVSQDSDADVVQEAFRIGALGYVVKVNAANDLLPAVDAVCQGKRFASAGLAGHIRAERADRQVSKRVHQHDVLGSPLEAGDD